MVGVGRNAHPGWICAGIFLIFVCVITLSMGEGEGGGASSFPGAKCSKRRVPAPLRVLIHRLPMLWHGENADWVSSSQCCDCVALSALVFRMSLQSSLLVYDREQSDKVVAR